MKLRVVEGSPSLWSRLKREFRRHWIGYAILLAFSLAGAVLAPLFLPGASAFAGAFGGFAMGIYAALSAVPDRFLDDND